MVDLTFWMKQTHTTAGDATVYDCAVKMKEMNTDNTVILENGKPIGLFSTNDLLKKVVAVRKNPELTKIRDVMTPKIISVKKDTPYVDVLKMMKENHFRHIPVVDSDGKFLGMINIENLVR